jgi:hypothetical protein
VVRSKRLKDYALTATLSRRERGYLRALSQREREHGTQAKRE